MTKLTKFLLISALGISLGFGFWAFAQGTETAGVEEEVALDEEVSAQDLGVSEPRLLPSNPFYFLKNWGRGLQLAFTFNPVRKLELREKFANEKLLELKKLTEEKKNPKILEKATDNYQKEMDKVKNRAEKLKPTAKDKPKVESFLDKFIRHQALHRRILEKLEKKVPPQAFKKIEGARKRHLERFKDVVLKLEKKEKIPEKLEKNLEKVRGSKFKAIKDLELLKSLEEKVPEDKKEAIQKAEERIMNNFKERIEKMPPKQQGRLKEYLNKVPGDKEKQLEILENLKKSLKDKPEIQKRLMEGRRGLLKRIVQMKKAENCPKLTPLSKDFCKEGRVIIKRDKKGCPNPVCIKPGEETETKEIVQTRVKKCLKEFLPKFPEEIKTCIKESASSHNPGEKIGECVKKATPSARQDLRGIGKELSRCLRTKPVCYTLWNPVCGKNGKTYSNACFAKAAGVEIAYKGMCREKEGVIKIEPKGLVTFFYIINQISEDIEVEVSVDGKRLFTKRIEARGTQEVKAKMRRDARIIKVLALPAPGSALTGREKEFEVAKIPGKQGFKITITKSDIIVARDYLPVR